jgi:hypothetical protein
LPMLSMTAFGGMILSMFSGVQVTSRFVVVIFGGTSRDSADGISVVCDVVAEEHAPSSKAVKPVDIAIGRKVIKSNFYNINNI